MSKLGKHASTVCQARILESTHSATPSLAVNHKFHKFLYSSTILDTVHDEIRGRTFNVPHGNAGNAGKSFVNELAQLFQAFIICCAVESVALQAAITLPLLLLQ